jgi:hypothetical protein
VSTSTAAITISHPESSSKHPVSFNISPLLAQAAMMDRFFAIMERLFHDELDKNIAASIPLK